MVADEVQITRVVRFSAAHRYHSEQLTDDENREAFGLCNRKHGHGHNYVVEVSVAGPVDAVTGMVMNLADLDRILREHVVRVLDHTFLNYDIAYFADHIPTCENIVLYLANELRDRLGTQQLRLTRVRVRESDDLFATLDLGAVAR